MRLLDVAQAHLKLRKGRTAFLLLGMVLCLGTVVSFYLLTHGLQVEYHRQMEQTGIRLLVTPEGLETGDSYLGVPVGSPPQSSQTLLPKEYLQEIRQLDLTGLDLVSPKLVLASDIMGRQVLLCGLDFQLERALQDWWELEAGDFPKSTEEIMLGFDLAASLGLKPGDGVHFSGKTYPVSGILLPTGRGEDKLFFMDWEEMMGLTGVEGISLMELRFQVPGEQGNRDSTVEEWVASLEANLPGIKVTRVIDEREARQELLMRISQFAGYGALIVFLLNWLMVAVAMMSSVKERVGEIGILRAMGYRQRHIINIIMLEAGMITGVGGILGFAAGVFLGALLIRLLGGTGMNWAWSLWLFFPVQVLSWLIGLTAAGYPAYKAAQLDPVPALRQL
jgi:putative ABC transport system permease protein